MKIMSWNVAGVRARLPLLSTWLKEHNYDIICLQETKVQDKDFPFDFFESFGYQSSYFGQKSFNGVAILSKITPDEVVPVVFCQDHDMQARFLEATFSYKGGAFRVASVYVPNGNPLGSEKYAYRMSWLEEFYLFARQRLCLEEATIIGGDFNILPSPNDAKTPESWKDDSVFAYEGRQIFYQLCNQGYEDAMRLISKNPDYTFWDFRKNAFSRDDGIRIDHFLLSPQATDLLKNAYVKKEVRGLEKTSDHAPIVLELNINF